MAKVVNMKNSSDHKKVTTEDERGEAGEAGGIEFGDSSIVETTAAPRVSDAHMRSTATRGILILKLKKLFQLFCFVPD